MPDYKRINAPENTHPYSLYSLSNLKYENQEIKTLLNNDTRLDGRKAKEHRKICTLII